MMKDNRLIVVVNADYNTRLNVMAKLSVQLGFAQIPSDAKKIIKVDIDMYDLNNAYFVLCSNYDFRGRVSTNYRLLELAARGICVMLGVKTLPREFEFISNVYYAENLR